jgi:hypothetical protein
MKVDYSIYYKSNYTKASSVGNNHKWNLLISAFNDSERVREVFNSVQADEKHFLMLPEYGYAASEFPSRQHCFAFPGVHEEYAYLKLYFDKANLSGRLEDLDICVDITGFMRPHLVCLVRLLAQEKVTRFTALYSDPNYYVKKENTTFTKDDVELVRQIHGCEGVHISDSTNDLLVIGAGYDHKLITSVAENKALARKIQIFGLPSLQPDMYQENVLRAYKAEEAVGQGKFLWDSATYYAPANDPFITAQVIQMLVEKVNSFGTITNLYLSPLSTKAQVLGFAIFYVWECIGASASIIFPFCNQYTRETTRGLKRIWQYTVELPNSTGHEQYGKKVSSR